LAINCKNRLFDTASYVFGRKQSHANTCGLMPPCRLLLLLLLVVAVMPMRGAEHHWSPQI